MKQKAIILAGCLLLGWIGAVQAASPPDYINYQGVLRNSSGEPLGGTYGMVFRFFSADTGGDEVLVDTHAAVTVSGGLFNVALGSGSVTDGSGPGTYTTLARVLADYPDPHLEVQVAGETLSPRIRIVSAGYALNTRYVRGVEIISEGPLDLYVDPVAGDDGDDGLSPATAKATIQAAINEIPLVLTDAATVHLADGTYSEGVVLDRRQRQGLHWISVEGNPGSPQSVVFDGLDALDFGLIILDSVVRIEGVTFSSFVDAAVEVFEGSLAITFSDCRFTDNAGDGAIYAENSSISIRNCEFLGNTNGIVVGNSRLSIEGNCVMSNNGPYPAISVSHGSFLHVEVESGSCTITGNNGTGVLVERQSVLSMGNGPLDVSNNDRGVVCTSGSHISFGGHADLTVMNNTSGDLLAGYQSTIRGYANGTTGECTADAHSTCEP